MDAIQIGFQHFTQAQEVWFASIGTPHLNWVVLAQEIRDPDVLGQIQNALKTFIESGQVWALIIGCVLGFGFRSMLP